MKERTGKLKTLKIIALCPARYREIQIGVQPENVSKNYFSASSEKLLQVSQKKCLYQQEGH